MTDKLFIAEKPSLAKAIATALGTINNTKPVKENGCFTVGEDKVVWLFGHMYGLVDAEVYNPAVKPWNVAVLPIIPEPDEWKLKITGKDSKDISQKKKHVENIVKLARGAKTLVNAGDAGREGQLLVDELLIENGFDAFGSNTYRFWTSSMAASDLVKACQKIFPNAEKKSLYEAAVARQRADWMHGINLTINYTVLARQAGADIMASVGRVQSPVVRLVADRDDQIKNFKPVDHYLPTGEFEHENGKFTANWVIPDGYEGLDSEGRLVDKSVAEKVLERIKGKSGEITGFKSEDKKKAPPLPFSLSELQKECSAKLGLTAKKTLDVAQKLYETHRVASYPRSDSRYLNVAILTEQAPTIIENLTGVTGKIGTAASNANLRLKSAAWNDSKTTDHHGIIPTNEATQSRLEKLDKEERAVFDIIAKQFIAQFYPDQRWKALSANVSVGDDKFKASGRQDVDAGWKVVFSGEAVDDDEKEASLPTMARGDAVKVLTATLSAKRTSPPSYFTDGTLIDAMVHIDRFEQNPELKKRLKGAGLGTEATRSNIIEMLINRRKFLERKGKHIRSTALGKSVVDLLPATITSPGMTAIWEGFLEQVEKGQLALSDFLAEQAKLVRKRIEDSKGIEVLIKGVKKVTPIAGDGESCPKCAGGKLKTVEVRKGEYKGRKFLACDQSTCDHKEGERVPPLPGHGESCPKCGEGKMLTRKSQKGAKFLSCNRYPECNHIYDPMIKKMTGDGEACPVCDSGKLVTKKFGTKSLLSCDTYPACGYMRQDIKPAKGHGDACPNCSNGKMETQKSKAGKVYLKCTNSFKKSGACDTVIFPKEKELPGDGETCTKCKKSKMVTRKISKGKNAGKFFLACMDRDCGNAIWPD